MHAECSLSRDEFSTFLQEAASVVNHTPLGNSSSNASDPFPVSPAALLQLREAHENSALPKSEPGDLMEYGRKRWRRVQFLADQFWIRWKRDYMRAASVRKKWHKNLRNVKVGDVVLLREETPRNKWPLALVTAIHSGGDGVVRKVTVRKGCRSDRMSREFIRAVCDLVVLVPVDSTSRCGCLPFFFGSCLVV